MGQSTEQTRTKPIPKKFQGDMIIAPECLMTFIGFLIQRIGDGPMIAGTSIFKDKINEKVASEHLTIHSRPVSGEIVSGYFVTNDGHKAEDSTIVENGILKSYQLGLYGANKTGLPRAVNSGGCYVMEAGQTDLEEMIGSIKEGVLLTRFSGGRPNDRGDFSGVAKNSYYIADGKIQYPICETTASGNMVNLLKSIRGVSRERLDSGNSILPYVHVSGVTAS
jgi:PmbA protein